MLQLIHPGSGDVSLASSAGSRVRVSAILTKTAKKTTTKTV